MGTENWLTLNGPPTADDALDGRPAVGDDELLRKLLAAHKQPRLDLAPELVRPRAERKAGQLLAKTAKQTTTNGRVLHCKGCGAPIERASVQPMLYCSEVCRRRAKSKRGYRAHQGDRTSYAKARRTGQRAQAQPRECERCGSAFQPFR